MICNVPHFGLAQDLNEDVYVMPTEQELPIKWMAPEAVMYNRFTASSTCSHLVLSLMKLSLMGRLHTLA